MFPAADFRTFYATIATLESDTMSSTIPDLLQSRMLEWMGHAGVLGAGEGTHRGKPCIVILVERKTRELERTFPERLDGVRLVLKEVGRQNRSGKST